MDTQKANSRKGFLSLLFIFCFSISCFGNGQLFYIATHNSELLKIDIENCDTTYIGQTGTVLLDIAITPDYRLYGTNGTYFYEVDTATGSLTHISSFAGLGNINSMVSDSSGNILIVSNDSLYYVDRFTGQYISHGFYGNYVSGGDLTFYKDTLYLVASGNQLVKIILYPALSSQLVGTMSASYIYGINALCINNVERLVVSGYNNSYSSFYNVDPNNASLTLLCDSIVHTLIHGAASEHDYDSNAGCIFISNINDPAAINNVKVFPNPAADELNVLSSSTDRSEISLFDIHSKEMLKLEFTGSVHLDISNLSAGIYFYQIKDRCETVVRGKLIKEN